jgi:regulator of protease activity HflC (stomatin/prohibitin superfamily)
MVIERLGKFSRVLKPGINCLIPFLDSPKQFVWGRSYVNHRGQVINESRTLTRVDLRETALNFPAQDVYTVDTVQMRVNAVMYYRIRDVEAAVYQVDDLTGAIRNVAQAQLKDVFGSKTMSAALQGQKAVNDYLNARFSMVSPCFARSGLRATRWGVAGVLQVGPRGVPHRTAGPQALGAQRHCHGDERANEGRT